MNPPDRFDEQAKKIFYAHCMSTTKPGAIKAIAAALRAESLAATMKETPLSEVDALREAVRLLALSRHWWRQQALSQDGPLYSPNPMKCGNANQAAIAHPVANAAIEAAKIEAGATSQRPESG